MRDFHRISVCETFRTHGEQIDILRNARCLLSYGKMRTFLFVCGAHNVRTRYDLHAVKSRGFTCVFRKIKCERHLSNEEKRALRDSHAIQQD